MTTLHITETGHGPPLVLGHGFTQDSSIFDGQVAALSSDYTVLTWDAPSHGRSPARSGPFTHAALADDIAEALVERGINRAVIGGSSQGGWVSMHVALRHPELVAGLVLMACSAHPQAPAYVEPTRQEVLHSVAHGTSHEHAAGNALSNLGPDAPQTDQWIADFQALDLASYVDAMEALVGRPDLRGDLVKIDVPVLVIRGELDPWVQAQDVDEMIDLLPDAKLVTIPGGWHTVSVTHADDVSKATAPFLKAIAPW